MNTKFTRQLNPTPHTPHANSKGFTLIEVIVVVTILAIISYVSVLSFGLLYRSSIIKTTTDELVEHIRDAQHRSVTGFGNVSSPNTPYNWGIKFESPTSYWIFKGTDFSSADADSFNFKTDPLIAINATVDACSSTCVIFEKITGRPTTASGCTSPPCQIQVTLSGESSSRYICINSEGRVSVSTAVC